MSSIKQLIILSCLSLSVEIHLVILLWISMRDSVISPLEKLHVLVWALVAIWSALSWLLVLHAVFPWGHNNGIVKICKSPQGKIKSSH